VLDRDPGRLVSPRAMRTLRSNLDGIASSAGSTERRVADLFGSLGDVLPHAAACMAVRDPDTGVHRLVGWSGSTEPVVLYLERTEAEAEIEFLGLDRLGPPVQATALPVPLEQTLIWSEFLLPAGFVDGFTVSLWSDDGRHLGIAGFLTDAMPERTAAHSHLVDQMRPYLARALDRLPSLAAVAELSEDVLGGVALTRSGEAIPLPGLPGHPLLTAGSPVLAYARRQLSGPGVRASFLAPFGSDLGRISALDLQSVVLVRPAGELHGLGTSDLQRLGARLEGWGDQRISARFPRWHGMVRGSTGSADGDLDRQLVRAGREGLFIPPALW
jgi:hypothetical protein